MSSPVTVSLSEASRRSGVSTTQLRRWIEAGKLPGTARSSTGSYLIPVAELIEELPAGSWDRVEAVTVTPDARVTVTPDAPETVSAPVIAERLAQAERTIEELRERLEYAESRRVIEREQAERQSRELVEKLTDAIATLSRALPSAEQTPESKRRRWRKREK